MGGEEGRRRVVVVKDLENVYEQEYKQQAVMKRGGAEV